MKSEADKIYRANFIKVPFSAGSYKEVNNNLKRAYHAGKDIKYVIRSLDYSMLVRDKDYYDEGLDNPTYLYNDKLFDDLNYVLNKSIFLDKMCAVFQYTKSGNKTTSFDEYAHWNAKVVFGAGEVLKNYTLGERANDN